MLRLAMIGPGILYYHGAAFGSIFNGFAPERAKERSGLLSCERIPDAQIVGIWLADQAKAREFASLCNVKNVYSRPEDCLKEVDGILIPDDTSLEHAHLATPLLASGIPLFIDKPVEHRPDRFAELMRQFKAAPGPVMTSSALRFDPEILRLRGELEKAGNVVMVQASGPDARGGKEFVYYGVHTLEMVYALLGPGVASVIDTGNHDDHCITLKYENGRQAQLFTSARTSCFSISAVMPKDRWTAVSKGQEYYRHMLLAFVKMVETRRSPVPLGETEELFQVMFAVEESLKSGKAVSIR